MIEVSLGPQKLKKDVLMAEEKKKILKPTLSYFFEEHCKSHKTAPVRAFLLNCDGCKFLSNE